MRKWQIIENLHYTNRIQTRDPYTGMAIAHPYIEIIGETIEGIIEEAIEEMPEMA